MRTSAALHRILVGALLVCAGAIVSSSFADKVHSQTSKANAHYKKKQYEKALGIYDTTLLENPDQLRLEANRGNALHQLGRFSESDSAYQRALQLEDKRALADIHYNRGNTLYRQGEQLMSQGQQGAQEAFKSAMREYGQSLDLRPSDREAKWNLQLAYARMQQAQQQEQNQQNQDKDKQDKDKNQDQQQKQDQQKDKQQDQEKKQDDKNQNQQDKQDQQKDQDKKQEQSKKQDEQGKQEQQQAQQSDKEKKMKQEEAARMLRQFADDDKALNKPDKKVEAAVDGKPEKDW